MSFLSKVKPLFTATLGGCAGGLTVYYVLSAEHGISKLPDEASDNEKETYRNYEKWVWDWDRRDPKSLVKPIAQDADESKQNAYNAKLEIHKPKAVRHIFLIRHGQYNLDGKTDPERSLTELGEVQAALTGKRLRELNFPYTQIIQSTMTRATQTASYISKQLPEVPVKSCSMIEEGAPCPPEPPLHRWKPELRQFYEDGARIEAAFRKYIHRAAPSQEKDSYEIIVCHGNVIRYFLCRALQFPPNAWLRFSIHHASITWLTISPSGKVSLRVYGDAGHMPPDFLTTG